MALTQQHHQKLLDRHILPVSRKLDHPLDVLAQLLDDRVDDLNDQRLQLLTSLKALERAPARKYEFRSLYEPYQLLHEVLFDQENNQGNFKQLKQNWAQIKDLSGMIQNFSTTLHSTLRNDLQFFQVNDFNAIAHYAPAKLRAFYAAWVSELVDYYQMFQKERNLKKYAFLVVPDNGSQANTKELKRKNMAPIRFVRGGQLCAYRIMCINLPERLLYTPEIACVILAHEVAHFGGGQAKRRAGTKGDAWGEDRLSAYIRSLSIWCALMINSTMLSFLDEKVYTETTQGFSAVAKQAFQLYLKRTMAETSFLSTHIEDLLAGYWGRTAEKFDEQTNTGVECIGIARIVLQQFVDKSKSEMNLSDYDYLMLDMETDFSKYLDENWKNPEWRRRCSEKIEGSGLLEELWNEELPHCHIVGEIVHILVFVLILRHCLLYRSRFPHPRHFAFKRIALLCATIQVAKALQDLLLQIRFICVVIPVFFPLVQNQPGAEHRCTQQLARIIQRVSGIILFVLAGRCHCFQQIDQRHLTRNIAIIALSNNIIQASFFLLGNVIFCSCSFKL